VDESVVSYSVKELLANLDRKMDDVLALVHGKADSSEVDRLRTELADVRQELADVRQDLAELKQREAVQEQHETKSTEWKRWLINAAAAFLLVAATVATSLLASR
jgi:uncharacterized membrane protein